MCVEYERIMVVYEQIIAVLGESRAACLEAENSLVEKVHFQLPSVDRVQHRILPTHHSASKREREAGDNRL